MLTSMMCVQTQSGGVNLLGEHEYEIVVGIHPSNDNCYGYSAVDKKGTYGRKIGGDSLLKEFSVIHVQGGGGEAITIDLGETPSNYRLDLKTEVVNLSGIPCRNGKFHVDGILPPIATLFYYLDGNLGQKIKFKVFVREV